MLWHALPPEVNTARLMAGAGPAPMLQAAAGWEALGNALEAQAVELGTTLAALQGMWTGAGSERAIAAAAPMIAWLQDAAGKSQQRALQASAQATAYLTALATTPTLIEIVINHITHGVLVATNFLGINLMPIGFNEVDYFGRMWNQAAAAMDIYQAETVVNTFFEPMLPMKPILVPEVGQAMSEALSGAQQLLQSAGPTALRQLAAAAEDAADVVPNSLGLDEQTMALLSQLGQLGQQLGGPMQQLMQPIQQFASMAGQGGGMGGSGMGGGMDGPAAGAGLGDRGLGQMGLLGANALSNHPLAGGSGPSAGLGMMHAEALPGAAGSDPRTSLMSQLIDKPEMATAGAGSSASGGAAPMGGGMGAAGAGAQSGGSNRSATPAPALAAEQSEEPFHEGFDDGEDW